MKSRMRAHMMTRKKMKRVIRIWGRSSETRLTSMTWTTTFLRRAVIQRIQASSDAVRPVAKEERTHPASAAATVQAKTVRVLTKTRSSQMSLQLERMRKRRSRLILNSARNRSQAIAPPTIRRTCKSRAILLMWWVRMLRANVRRLGVSRSAIMMWAAGIMTLHRICLASCPETPRRRDCVGEVTSDSSLSSRKTMAISNSSKKNSMRSRRSI